MPIAQSSTPNLLLKAISPRDFDAIRPQLEAVPLKVRQALEEPNVPISHVYFPDSGLGSVVASDHRQRRSEVGIFGREGMSGLAVLTGAERCPNESFVQIAGSAHRIASHDLRKALRRAPAVHALFIRYVQAVLIQTAHTALANGRLKVEERLARWLLMAQDRVGNDIRLTHEFLALMLGVRRPGVTVALQHLEARGLICSARSDIRIINREGLIELADGSYGIPEAEHERLVGRAACC